MTDWANKTTFFAKKLFWMPRKIQLIKILTLGPLALYYFRRNVTRCLFQKWQYPFVLLLKLIMKSNLFQSITNIMQSMTVSLNASVHFQNNFSNLYRLNFCRISNFVVWNWWKSIGRTLFYLKIHLVHASTHMKCQSGLDRA